MHCLPRILYIFNANWKCYVKIISHFKLIFLNETKPYKNILANSKTFIILLEAIRNINTQTNQEQISNKLIILYVSFGLFFLGSYFLCLLFPICFFIFIWNVLEMINALSPFILYNFKANWKYYFKIISYFKLIFLKKKKKKKNQKNVLKKSKI